MSDDEIRLRDSTPASDTGVPAPQRERAEDDGSDEDDTQALSPGDQLGRYEIRSLLGAGGMGRVYAARDPTLEREVAIKALAHSFQRDAGRMKRFVREAKVLAALSHPNIAAIYGFEELDGARYLVLEKVDGGDLARKLESGPLPLREAISIAAQVADGLAEAHAKGVIHRDLKPSNVMLSANGRVKLVDFGVAKSIAGPAGGGRRSELTVTAGAAVGTFPYMSPEQVRGEEVDERSDVWAFGCLLFEMLTGSRAFPGLSTPEVLVAILRDEPNFSLLPPSVPPPVRWLIRRCLHREPEGRPRHLGDLRLELLETIADPSRPPSSGTAVELGQPAPVRRRATARVALLAAGVGAAVVAGVALLLRTAPRAAPAAPFALSLELPRGLELGDRNAPPFAFAPDGSTLVFEASAGGAGRLYARRIDDPAAVAIDGTENGWQPFFSPDGAWLGFFAGRKLVKVALAGGPPEVLGEFGNSPRGAVWLDDGTIVVAPSQTSGLVRLAGGGGKPLPLTTLDAAQGESSHRWPAALPGGRAVLFTVGFEASDYDEARLDVVSLESGERRPLLSGAAFGRHAPSGHLLFVREGRLHAVELDLRTMSTRGTPKLVVDGVQYDPRIGAASLALGPNGALVYTPGVATSTESYLSWLGPDGRLERISETPRLFREPRISPDGSRVAVVVGTGAEANLRVLDEGGTSTQLSFGFSPYRPAWSPDGRSVAVGALRDGRWQLLALADDGSGRAELLLEQEPRTYPCDWTPDGRALVFQQRTSEHGWDLHLLPIGASGKPAGPSRALAATPFNEANAVVSRDGRWIAYESDELDGLFQIYARSLPDGERKVRISTGGARWPSWSDDGSLAYWETGAATLRVVRTHERDGHLVADSIREPFAAEAFRAPPLSAVVVSVTGGRVSVHPAGDRFLVLESSAAPATAPLSAPVLLSDWSARLRSGPAR